MSINKCFLTGNLTRDPEVRMTASGTPVMSFGLAFDERFRNSQTEQWESRPNFINCTMFGKRAEKVAQMLSKGSKATIEGHLRWSQWERDDEKRSSIELIVDEIDFASAKRGERDGDAGLYEEDVVF